MSTTNEEPIYYLSNKDNPAPYQILVNKDPELDQYWITLTLMGKKFSRIEKTRIRAVQCAKEINLHLEAAFRFTWEDQS